MAGGAAAAPAKTRLPAPKVKSRPWQSTSAAKRPEQEAASWAVLCAHGMREGEATLRALDPSASSPAWCVHKREQSVIKVPSLPAQPDSKGIPIRHRLFPRMAGRQERSPRAVPPARPPTAHPGRPAPRQRPPRHRSRHRGCRSPRPRLLPSPPPHHRRLHRSGWCAACRANRR